ncbi:MAG: TadA family conjugal transfer-associated ATPase, partial [Microbacteriaceae bacterium]|nr:TadA family conjugal transfer-associated ATPase [Microbacteriaceae bacterium]
MSSVVPFLPRSVRTGVAVRRPGASEFGVLAPLVADGAVTDLFVNGGEVWADRGSGLAREPALAMEAEAARALAVRLIGLAGRHVDEASPCVDARFGDGMRVHVVLPPIAPRGPLVSIRLPALAPWSIDALDEAGFFPGASRSRLEALVARRRNVLVSGATGSGKTTLLSAMLGLAPPHERIVVIEDVGELRIDHPHVVSLETRQANLEGVGGIGLARLVREALRMRPDRLVLGECRGEEIRDLLTALNTGHDGGAGTIHANSLADVPARLEALGVLAGLGPEAVARQAASALHAVVHVERAPGGRRRVAAIGRPVLDGAGRLAIA